MPWFYVDDGFSDSKPVMNLPSHLIRAPARLAVCGLWVLGGSWSAKEELDGFIPEAKLKQLGVTPTIRKLMTDPGPMDAQLFDATVYGVVARNWQKWQKTKAEQVAARKREADKKATYRATKKGRSYVVTSDDRNVSTRDKKVDTPVDSKNVSTGDTIGDSRARVPRPDPTEITTTHLERYQDSRSGISATPGADLVREIIPKTHPAATLTVLRLQASELLNTGTDPNDVAAALRLWLDKPALGTGRTILASLVSEVIKTRTEPNGQPTSKLRSYAQLAAQMRAEENAAPQITARKELQ